ncbi:MAG: HNH endonuclease [Lachnospiraceae bacterium]|nr:HNH endonuclease [Lachnospiraceae bacterium]
MKPIEINGDLVLSLAASVSALANNDEEDFSNYCDIREPEMLAKCVKPSRKTLLHCFIENVCCWEITYLLLKHFDEEGIQEMVAWMDSLNIPYDDLQAPTSDEDYDGIEAYADALQERFINMALGPISEATFAVLYSDKDFLFTFNKKVTDQIKKLRKEDYPEYLQGDGYLNRDATPQWLKDGVFYRDRGRCQECGTDLSKIFQNGNNSNYDHIIPLRQGGTNDPTNFQLMCEHCNKAKRDRSTAYRNIIWPYWDNK